MSLELILRASEGNTSAVLRILDGGTSVNSRDDQEMTAMMAASWKGNVGMVKLLIDRGADVNLQDAYKRTALVMAVVSGSFELVKLLMRFGADPFMQDRQDRIAYDIAIENGQDRIAGILPNKEMLSLLRHGKTSLARLQDRSPEHKTRQQNRSRYV